jgi:hypothetical protein
VNDMQKLADTLAAETHFIEGCVQSAKAANVSTKRRPPGPLKSLLEKALDEVQRGNPEEGARLIELSLLKDADTGILIFELLKALDRASFVLSRIHEGDHNVLRNALEVATDIKAIAKASGGAHE